MWSKEEIGKVIKESRLSAGLTQVQVAEALGRPQNTISAWEMGRAQPDANTLFELFQVLGRSVDEAFGFTKQPFEVTKYEIESIKRYRTLDWHGQEAVDSILDVEYRRCKMEQIDKATAGIKSSKERAEVADKMLLGQKTPTPVTEDGQDDIEEFVRKHKKNLTVDQTQKVLGMMQAMITPQKQQLSVSAQQIVGEKFPKTEHPDRS